MMSSRRLVPPVVTITFTSMCFASSIQIWDVCSANSLVGTMTNAWITSFRGSTLNEYKILLTKFIDRIWDIQNVDWTSPVLILGLNMLQFFLFHFWHVPKYLFQTTQLVCWLLELVMASPILSQICPLGVHASSRTLQTRCPVCLWHPIRNWKISSYDYTHRNFRNDYIKEEKKGKIGFFTYTSLNTFILWRNFKLRFPTYIVHFFEVCFTV